MCWIGSADPGHLWLEVKWSHCHALELWGSAPALHITVLTLLCISQSLQHVLREDTWNRGMRKHCVHKESECYFRKGVAWWTFVGVVSILDLKSFHFFPGQGNQYGRPGTRSHWQTKGREAQGVRWIAPLIEELERTLGWWSEECVFTLASKPTGLWHHLNPCNSLQSTFSTLYC